MADQNVLSDLDHYFSQDLAVGTTGDLATVTRLSRSRQRVLRRLLTNPGAYAWHPDYGAGLPAMIGDLIDIPKIRGRVIGHMLLEASVQPMPGPQVVVTEITGGVSVVVNYVALPDKQPVSLSFDVKV